MLSVGGTAAPDGQGEGNEEDEIEGRLTIPTHTDGECIALNGSSNAWSVHPSEIVREERGRDGMDDEDFDHDDDIFHVRTGRKAHLGWMDGWMDGNCVFAPHSGPTRP